MFVLVAISNITAPKILQLRIPLPPLYPLAFMANGTRSHY